MTGRLLTRRMIPALVAALSLGVVSSASALEVSSKNNTLSITDSTGDPNVVTFWRGQNEGGHQVIYVHQATGPQDIPDGYPDNWPVPNGSVPLIPDLFNGCTTVTDGTTKCTSTAEKFANIDVDLGAQRDFISNPAADSSQGFEFEGTPTGTPAIKIDGGADGDVLQGSAMGDTLIGGAGNDELRGMAGNDTLLPGEGQNTIRGGVDIDTVDFSNSNGDRTRGNQNNFISLDGFPNDGAGCTLAKTGIPADCEGNNVRNDVENITTGDGADQILASDVVNVINTGKGADIVYALGDNDQVNLGDGNDYAEGGGGVDTINGGLGEDELHGGLGGDNLNGNTGLPTASDGDSENTLYGDDGNDTINGGSIKDTIYAGNDNDTVHAGDGNNVIDLGAGDDGVETDSVDMAGSGNDTITGGAGSDYIKAGAGDNVVDGGTEVDKIFTLGGDDKVLGGDGNDQISTGGGNDYLQGGLGGDGLNAGGEDTSRQSRQFAGEPNLPPQAFHGDTIDYSDKTGSVYAIVGDSNSGEGCAPPNPTSCEGDSITSAENFIGGEGNDWFVGDASPNTLSGHGGSDILDGKAGNDVLIGGDGDDTQLLGGAGGDWISGGNGTDSVSYWDTDHNGVNVTLDGTANDGSPGENDNLQSDIENIDGSDGNDNLSGSDVNNHIWGHNGNDTLIGGGGSDTLEGNAGVDLVDYHTRSDDLHVSLDNVANDGGAGENDNVTDTVENIDTGSGNDVVSGTNDGTLSDGSISNGANVIHTNAGNDTLDGLTGPDDLNGGDGNDTVIYSGRASTDKVDVTLDDINNDGTTLVFGSTSLEKDNVHFDIENITAGEEADQLEGSILNNVIDGGGGNDILFGDQGDDTVIGGAGDDEIQGGDDKDLLVPGVGADIVSGEGGSDKVDYSERTAPVSVTFDNEPNDGEAGEGDNVLSDVEDSVLPAANNPPADNPPADNPPADNPPANNQQNNNQQVSDTPTTKVDPTTTQKDPDTTSGSSTPSESSMQTTVSAKKFKGVRSVLVRGRILVKARNGVAKASASCKGGGKVLVTVRKGSKVVGKKLVKVSKTCTFLAPVTLAKGTTGKLKVEVKFLGNRALKATKRTTSLQVNG